MKSPFALQRTGKAM